MNQRNVIAGALVVTAASVVGLAYAQKSVTSSENDAIADAAKAKVTLAQAVAVAQGKVPGTAIRAELDAESGRAVYSVEVLTGDKSVMDVKVDAETSEVISAKPDSADRGSCDAEDD